MVVWGLGLRLSGVVTFALLGLGLTLTAVKLGYRAFGRDYWED